MSFNPLWTPSRERQSQSRMRAFGDFVNYRHNMNLDAKYAPLWEWSVNEPQSFWSDVWDFMGVIGEKGDTVMTTADKMQAVRFFPNGRINFAENMLVHADERDALISWDENGKRCTYSRSEVLSQAMRLAAFLRANGVTAGVRVGAYLPNIPETVIAFLATASLGAVFSSCSIDFGADSVIERLGQIAPKVLIVADGYRYGKHIIARTDEITAISKNIPSIKAVVVVPYLNKTPPAGVLPVGAFSWAEAIAGEALNNFQRVAFNAPLLIMFSSGTTGAPKCIVHSTGGVLLQHLKELALHTDIHSGQRVFYFTTCGWMMWNWITSALALEAVVVLYEGNPFSPSPAILWDMAQAESLSVFGASAKYFDALRKAKVKPCDTHRLSSLRTICSTGSPLPETGFEYVYHNIKEDVCLASISGGTDIVSCFVLGNPFDSVYGGRIQCRGLGMAVNVYGDDAKPLQGGQGDLVCERPFPSMPIGFWNDDDGACEHAAYYDKHPGVWTHGDWATQYADGTFIIHGRSDATLNPGGVRIGTAEIYRHVEIFEEVTEALAVSQEWENDVRIILFVRLAGGAVLDDELKRRLSVSIRSGASPRHVPAKIISVPDIPRTRSGKITEIAVREVIHQRSVKNVGALANPESLDYFKNLIIAD